MEKMNMNDIENIELSFLSLSDYEEFKEAMISSYNSMPESYWSEHHIEN